MGDKFICCICGEESVGYGNNPDCWDGRNWDADDRCCDKCNSEVVVPNRILAMCRSK